MDQLADRRCVRNGGVLLRYIEREDLLVPLVWRE